MTDPATWIVLIMVVRWIYWSVLWWWGALFRPAAWNDGSDGVAALPPGVAAQVAIQLDGGLVLRIDLAGLPGWPGGVPLNGSQ
jgi:hypothetical protein